MHYVSYNLGGDRTKYFIKPPCSSGRELFDKHLLSNYLSINDILGWIDRFYLVIYCAVL